jgi:hypothetical protein
MIPPDEIDEDLARAYGGRRESDAEGLQCAGLAEPGQPGSERGSVAGSGRSRAAAGMTDSAPRNEELKRWMVRLGGLEPEAGRATLEAGASLAIDLIEGAATAVASGEPEPLLDCAESFALDLVRRRTAPASAAPAVARPPARALGYQDLAATARLRDLARRRVEELRREVFASTRTPFATLAEAVAWIEAEYAQAGDASSEELATFLAAHREIDRQLAQLFYQGSPYECAYTYHRERLLYLRPGSAVRRYRVGKSGTLMSLYYGLKTLASDLRVNDWEAADFVLLSVPPMVPRYRIAYRDRIVFDAGEAPREMVTVPWLELEIHDRFFSYEDFREVYRDLARGGFLLSKKSAAQLAKLRRLWEFVGERRPRKRWGEGAMRRPLPWRLVLSQWNAANPGETYCLSGIQKAYKEAGDYLAGRPTTASRRRRRPRPEVGAPPP